ncbi:MAG: DUF3048 domain-containing protein [Oscillospiraceae bacterium]|jgi:hypothetical protein
MKNFFNNKINMVLSAVLVLLIIVTAVIFIKTGTGDESSPSTSPAAVQSASPEPSVTISTPSPTPTPEPTPTPPPEHMNPLTGLEVDAGKVNARPVAVVMNNIKQAQPQYGISEADIIYEVCAEGGITRMLALYQNPDGVGSIGSVRSARPYFVEIALSHDAIFLHAGGSYQAYDYISINGATALDAITGGYEGSLFWRDRQRIYSHGYEHSMFTSGQNIASLFPKYNIRREHESGYSYEVQFEWEVGLEGGTQANTVMVEFSGYKTGKFVYDPDTRLYGAWQYGAEHIDAGNNRQVAASNLLVLFTEERVLDSEGRLAVTLTGTGSGKFFCGGKCVDITWSRPGICDQFRYYLEDGSPVTFERGKTYVCIIQNGNSVDIE